MKSHKFLAAFLPAVCCALLCLCSCGRMSQRTKKTVSPEILNLLQKTQSELATCAELCRSEAKESKDRNILLALANSQQILADRHETIIDILLKRNKADRISTDKYAIEIKNRQLYVLPPPEEYKKILNSDDSGSITPEVLITFEITDKTLTSDIGIQALINPDAENGLDLDFHLCSVCGNLTVKKPEGNCPVCNSDKDRIIRLLDGEIPPPKEGSYIVGTE